MFIYLPSLATTANITIWTVCEHVYVYQPRTGKDNFIITKNLDGTHSATCLDTFYHICILTQKTRDEQKKAIRRHITKMGRNTFNKARVEFKTRLKNTTNGQPPGYGLFTKPTPIQ